MTAAEKYTSESLLSIHRWAAHLFSFRLSRSPAFSFTAGQFARLGLIPDEGKHEVVWRPYSVVSASKAPYLEFFSVEVPGGQFSQFLARQAPGAQVLVDKTPYGFLTTERFVDGRDLWMIATGTGLAPFVSMLYDDAIWQGYRNLVLVHSVRQLAELAYQDEFEQIALQRQAQSATRLHYVPVVTREASAGTLGARIPELIASGALEARLGLELDPVPARVLLCGNPDMVTAVRGQLTARGFATPRRGQPGTLSVENYW